jgi:hypothetical protein
MNVQFDQRIGRPEFLTWMRAQDGHYHYELAETAS